MAFKLNRFSFHTGIVGAMKDTLETIKRLMRDLR
jgi:hypothetical protein